MPSAPKDPDDPEQGSVARSFSGNEQNRMFIQTEDNFDDVTLVSGVGTRKDSRGFVLFDFDHDGWLDLGVTSPQSPRFRIFRNNIGDLETETPNQSAFVTLEGGHQGIDSQSEWSARDAIGASFLVTMDGTRRRYQLSCGEGLASQNSRWIHVGMGQYKMIDQIDVLWPSGKRTTHQNIAAGTRVILHEDGRTGQ